MDQDEEPKQKKEPTKIDDVIDRANVQVINNLLPSIRLRKLIGEDNTIMEIAVTGETMADVIKLFDHSIVRYLFDLKGKNPPDNENPLTG